MTCHALVCLAAEIGMLPVVMIQTRVRTLLVAAIGTAPLLDARLLTTIRAAVAVATVAVLANPERGEASMVTADPLPENRLVSRHAASVRALDNGRKSWQVRTECW